MNRKIIVILLAAVVLGFDLVEARKPSLPSADMARMELNGGNVKSYAIISDIRMADTILFSETGQRIEKYYKEGDLVRDEQGRLCKTFYDSSFGDPISNYSVDTFIYVGNEQRPQMHLQGWFKKPYFALEEPKEWYYPHFQIEYFHYDGESNAPSSIFSLSIEIDSVSGMGIPNYYSYVSHERYNYLNVDRYGNWTKRETVRYYGSLIEDPQFDGQMINLVLDQSTTYIKLDTETSQRQMIEDFLLSLLMKIGQNTSNIEQRTYKYY